MKTLVLFLPHPSEQPVFFIVEEDWRKFDGIFDAVYSLGDDLSDEQLEEIKECDEDNGFDRQAFETLFHELHQLVYDSCENGSLRFRYETFKNLTKQHEWDIQITCGFLSPYAD